MSNQSTPDKYAPVSLEPVVLHGVDTGKMSVVLDDPTHGKTPVAIVGRNYAVWSNEDAVKVAEEIMHRSQFAWEPVHEIWDGKHLNSFWRTADSLIELPEVGDAIQLGLRLENSYDGTSRLRLAVMAYVLTCTNGMVADRRWGVFSVRHDQSMQVDWSDAAAQLEHGATNLVSHADHFRAMSTQPFQLESLLAVAANSGLNPRFMGNYVKQLAADDGMDSMSLWQAMNIGTHILSNPSSLAGVRQLGSFTDSFLELASSN